MSSLKNEEIEVQLLLNAIYLRYGYDFRSYAVESLKRRIKHVLTMNDIENLGVLQHRIIHDKNFFNKVLLEFSINVSEMFRDPYFFKALREKIIPELHKQPFIKIWHAGCSTGEEVYSMAILLMEEGLYDRSVIYATDFNEVVLKKAKEGIFSIDQIRNYTVNYQKAGGNQSFADYYTANYDFAVINQSLKKNIIFADHNLATDNSFNEMNLIMCRNVLIYFNLELQNRVFKLFYDSLIEGGFLCLGSKEDICLSKYSSLFEQYLKEEKIFRKRLLN